MARLTPLLGLTLFAMMPVGTAFAAQAPDPAAPSAPKPAAVTPVLPPTATTAPTGDAVATVEQLQQQIVGLSTTLRADIAALRSTWWERLTPAGIGLLGVFVGGLLSWLQQGRQLRLSEELQKTQLLANERIGRAKAGHDSLSKVVDYQTQQVNEFYLPLRLMLRRSSGVRQQLTDQMHAKDPQRYVYVEEADGRNHLFVADASGGRARFRLIEHMHELATRHAELMPLVREIVSIGVTITTLIDAKGGLALNSDRLTTLLGRYLAHFSILRDVTRKADENPNLLSTLHYNVAYPVELDAALDKDMMSITSEIETWKRLSRQMWDEASKIPTAPSS